MRILWVVNTPVGPLASQIGLSNGSGSWIIPTIDEINSNYNELYILVTYSTENTIDIEEGGVHFVALPTGDPSSFKINSRTKKIWSDYINSINPHIIQIWGTEYKHAKLAFDICNRNAEKIVYVQGVTESVYRCYFGNIKVIELLKNTSLIELLTGKSLFSLKHTFRSKYLTERLLINKADGVVLETEWSKNYYMLNTECRTFYHHVLPMNQAFFDTRWNIKGINKYTIFTSASDYPLKGLHFLIKALSHVKKIFPEVKLIVPGRIIEEKTDFLGNIKKRAYQKYLSNLISNYRLWDNICFVGVLSNYQMAENMKKAHLFVCTSVIENHSSTLREAMLVGTPCISGAVGGIPEYLNNNQNGLLVDPEDDIALAGNIIKIFQNDELAKKLSLCAHETIVNYYSQREVTLQDIYDEILRNGD